MTMLLEDDKRYSFYQLLGLSASDIRILCHVQDNNYAVTSRKWGLVARIDRPDWREFMAKQHAPWDPEGEGMDWVQSLDLHGHSAADFYRCVYSQDKFSIPVHLTKYVVKSSPGPKEYIP